MALTYRAVKGSALTITELDNNFRHFTGSHPIDGDLTISGSLVVSGSTSIDGPLYVTASSVVFDVDNGAYGSQFTVSGSIEISRDVIVRDDLFVYDDSNLRGDANIGYASGSDANLTSGYSLQVTQSAINNSGSAIFKGGITMQNLPTTEPNVTGSLWISGSSPNDIYSGYLMVFNP